MNDTDKAFLDWCKTNRVKSPLQKSLAWRAFNAGALFGTERLALAIGSLESRQKTESVPVGMMGAA